MKASVLWLYIASKIGLQYWHRTSLLVNNMQAMSENTKPIGGMRAAAGVSNDN
jgi:hypothetical protein